MWANGSSSGLLCRALEARFSSARALLVGRAALALKAVLECWRRRTGHCRVALPGAICHEVVVAVIAAGGEPVFCDVDPATGLVTESEWRSARARGANVVLVVHLYGNPTDTRLARSLFSGPDCLVIDDAAQALGSRHADGMAGTLGHIGLLSFGATKHVCTGNAAILFQREDLADEVREVLNASVPAPETAQAALAAAFRSRLEQARERLRTHGERAAGGFAGLLDGLAGTLNVMLQPDLHTRLAAALARYEVTAQDRVEKAELWSRHLGGSRLTPVGMAAGCVPWRYVCRLPGIGWSEQHRLSQALRAQGMHVSNWYLPAHWFLGSGPGSLPGVETLAREVFQFWLDESMSRQSIIEHAGIVQRELMVSA